MENGNINNSFTPSSANGATAPYQIRLAKAEEGDSKGEIFHFVRSLLLLAGTILFLGWAVF